MAEPTRLPAVKRILAPTDFSEIADDALEVAIDLARALGASIDLLHVYEASATLEYGLVLNVPDIDPRIEEHVTSELARRTERVRAAGVACEASRIFGRAAVEIVHYARSSLADLIVMSTMGRTGLRRMLLGSVTARVVPRAPCPVVVVPPPARGEPSEPEE